MKSHYTVLFICSGNSARSIMAEALLNHLGNGRFKAFSAGSKPTGTVNQHAIQALQEHKVSTEGLRSKSLDEFIRPDAPKIDLVFSVCAKAMQENCPVWPAHTMIAEWNVDDPAAIQGAEDQIKKGFKDALILLKRRIDLLTMLPIEKIDAMALRNKMTEIGKTI